MKNIILFIVTLFLLTGCSNKQPEKVSIKKSLKVKSNIQNYYHIEEFIYKKEQIKFFEKEYKNILKLNNKEILEKYVNFYEKNSSYFLNSFFKVRKLKEKIKNLDKTNSHKQLLTKALSLNKNDAINIYERLAHEGNIFAQRELANIYKYDNKLKSIFWYKKLIENNDIKSIKDFAFANLHMVNPIVVQDTKRAVELYERLDSLGEVSGLVHLGNIYEYGYFKNDIPVDKEKSLYYFQKAAAKGYTPAQKKLIKIYLCKKCKDNRYNKEKALMLLNILIEKGDEESKKILEKISSKEVIKEEVIQEEVIQKPKKEGSVE